MTLLHYFFILSFVLSTFMVFFSDSPVHSVLFLILAFFNASLTLFLFNIEFLSLVFLIIYLGALAILFLFIVMMLSTKKTLGFSGIKVVYVFGWAFLCYVLISIDSVFISLTTIFKFNNELSTLFVIDSMGDIVYFGQSLYNYYLPLVLIGGLILLVAMIGAIILTYEFKVKYSVENSLRQLSRTPSTVKLFY